MKLLILDNYESFTLFPYLQRHFEDADEVLKMGNLYSEHKWRIFKRINPDVVFVDFCDKNAVILTNRVEELNKKPRIVIRLHGYEVQSAFLNQIKWTEVDHLIVVSPQFKEIIKSKGVLPPSVGLHVIHNMIDINKFTLQEEFDDNAVAYAGYLNKKKGPTLLRTVMASMLDNHFHVATKYQDEHVRMYFEALSLSNVTFYGWTKTEEFLKGKRFILSTSVTESFGMSIAEGMAMGLTPAVHAWPGAEFLWPSGCIWRTFEELKYIVSHPRCPKWCREWVEDRYSMETCIEKVVGLLK